MLKLSAIIDKLIWLLILFLFSSFYVFNANEYSRFILLGITIVIFFLLLIQYGRNFHFYWHSFHTYVLLFALFCFTSYFWSIDPIYSLIKSSIIFQLLICMSVLYIYFLQKGTITPMIDIIMWAGYLISIYSFVFYGIDNVIYIVNNAERLDNSFSNANSIGMLVAFSSIITIYKILFDKFKLYHLLLILNIIIIAAAGSRTGLISFIIGICCIFIIKYLGKERKFSFLYFILICIIIIVFFKFLLTLPLFSNLNDRIESLFYFFTKKDVADGSTLTRYRMIQIGWELFLQNPLFGIGIGSSGDILASTIARRTYMHNNYIELLSGVGIIGTTLYYLMFLLPSLQLFKQRHSKDKNTMLCLIVIFLLLIIDFGSVSYITKSTYFYIMMSFIQVKINKRNLIGAKKENV